MIQFKKGAMLKSLTRRALSLGLRTLPVDFELRMRTGLESMPLSADSMIQGYLNGLFPMGDESGKLEWRCPPQRGLIPINDYRIPKNVKRLMRQKRFEIRVNSAFEETLTECASREQSWITTELADVFGELNNRGLITTVETWQDSKLVSAIFGITIGSFYSGESEFHKVPDAAKVAMVHLMKGLRCGGFQVHDAQYVSEYLKRYGAFEISREDYRMQLLRAVTTPAQFRIPDEEINNPDEPTRETKPEPSLSQPARSESSVSGPAAAAARPAFS